MGQNITSDHKRSEAAALTFFLFSFLRSPRFDSFRFVSFRFVDFFLLLDHPKPGAGRDVLLLEAKNAKECPMSEGIENATKEKIRR